MLLQDRKIKYFALFFAEVICLYVAGWILAHRLPACDVPFTPLLRTMGQYCLKLGGIQTLCYIVYWCAIHKLHKGLKYACTHARLMRYVRRALLDTGTGYGIEEYAGEEKVIRLPRIKITLSNDLTQGTVYIRNHLRYHKKLETVNISSALGRYIVMEQYLSDDMNYFLYEFEDSNIDRQLVFDSYNEFKDHCKNHDDYVLFMDNKNHVSLSSLLLVGATGSGKTYALYSLILQTLNWDIKPVLYFADPKNSSMFVLGNQIAPERTAGTVEDIILQLENFYNEMEQRKTELQDRLNEKLDADYRAWKMEPHIFICDEFSSFQGVVSTLEKKARDKINMMLRNIVLQGRQLGYFLWIVMQKSDSTDIPTAIRDNLIWKVVLGNAARTTYITAFEECSDLPQRKFGLGQGLFSYVGLTRQPEVCSFPTLNFDILGAMKQLHILERG